MLRPERMSRVSVTGSKRVIDDVIETVHDLNLVHFVDYDGSWEGFDPGDPMGPADETSERLVTVRAIESILGVEADDAEPSTSSVVAAEDFEEDLEEVRTEVNALDDRRNELREELRSVEDRIAAAGPFSDVGIDVDLLSGYDSLAVRVGEGDPEAVEAALQAADGIEAYEAFAGENALALFVHPADEGVLDEALVGVDFAAVEVPDAEGDPGEYVDELEHERERIEDELEAVEDEIDELKADAARFLLTAEERLTIQVQKAEAPLQFATTENAFVAEGWVPTSRYDELASALEAAVGDRVEVEELERADYDRGAHEGHAPEHPPDDESGDPTTGSGAVGGATAEAASGDDDAEEREAVADGGVATMGDPNPPVVQHNSKPVRPFELLTQAVGRPNYSELDPTLILFLTFPLMFGFMIGDVGYGLIYAGIGWVMLRRYDSGAFRNFGWITVAAGVMTVFFGVLYGEIFGLHTISTVLWDPLIGHAPIKKGLMPANAMWAQAWFVVTAVFGVVHMSVGYVFEFVENYSLHGAREAVLETGSWLLAITGLWVFVFTRPPTVTEGGETVFIGPKPDLIYRVFDAGPGAAIELGFSGIPGLFPVAVPVFGSVLLVELVGVAMVLLGAILILVGPTHEIIEIHVILAHALSYLRIAAVLLAKAGMAFAVNLLFFGAYQHHGEFHFMLSYGPGYVAENYPEAEVIFGGMIHGGPALLVAGVFVLVIGHIVVLALGVTSAGIQSVRLEYFEFFSKFYDGGGTVYSPFGHERRFTAEE